MAVEIRDKFPTNVFSRPGYVLTYPYVNEFHQIREYTKEEILAFRATEYKPNYRRNVI